MSAETLPPVWFERSVIPALVPEVAARVTILGPTPRDPWAGLDRAVAVMAGAGRYDAAFMARAPVLRVIARTGIGIDAVDIAEATRREIAVCNTPEGPTISTAEHAVTLMLMVAKNVKGSEAALRGGLDTDYYVRHEGIELDGKVLGLVGFGRIGRRVGAIAACLGMRIVAFDPFLGEAGLPEEVTRAISLDELLGCADVVSLHLPLTEATRALFGADQLARMKRGAILVNTARGGLVDSDALLEALQRGHLFGAGLDVTAPEPLPPGHPLLGRDDVVVTPHVASATGDGRVRIFRAAFEQVLDVIGGRRPRHLLNPDAWAGAAAPAGGIR